MILLKVDTVWYQRIITKSMILRLEVKGWSQPITKNNMILKLEKKFPCYNAVHKMGAEVGDEVVLVNAGEIIEISRSYGVDARMIGRVEPAEKKELIIAAEHGRYQYT